MSTIFVFGSNTQGRHGAGAALDAKRFSGAINGVASGPQGEAYAIITKELRPDHPPITIEQVAEGIRKFLAYAKECPDDTFYCAAIGCGLAGFKPEQIAPLFESRSENVVLPREFREALSSSTPPPSPSPLQQGLDISTGSDAGPVT